MTESDVKVIVHGAFDSYEKETALPRHTQNLGNFGKLFRALNQLKGAALAIGVIAGVPTVVAACIVIVKAIRGH